jgi:hypothetical protein
MAIFFAIGAWLSDDEFGAKFRDVTAEPEAEAKVPEWIEATVGDVDVES